MHRGPNVCNEAAVRRDAARRLATSRAAPEVRQKTPTGRSRSGGTPHREPPAAALRAYLSSPRTLAHRAFFKRVAATFVGEPFMPECNRQRFQPARQRLDMNFLNAQRSAYLPER